MKFEYDKKLGTMVPKKNEQIYFGTSIGGGLKVNDHKNNLDYIIERDGEITMLKGSLGTKGLHLYDRVDSFAIANRVLRMFGNAHKYSNYKSFMIGMSESHIKKFDEFV